MTFTEDLCRRHCAWAVDKTAFEEVPRGWYDLVEQLFEGIAAVMAERPGHRLAVWQLKEKFGGLRAYLGPAKDRDDAQAAIPAEVRALIANAERRSFLICDRCSGPGRLRAGMSFYATRCDGCAEPRSTPVADQPDGDGEVATLGQAAAGRPTGSVSLTPSGPGPRPSFGRAPAPSSDDEDDLLDLDLAKSDGPGDEAARDALAQALRPGHLVMDRAAIQAALDAAGFTGTYDHLSSGEEQRVRTLVHYRASALFRPHLIGSTAMLARLDALDRSSPNFEAVTRLVRRAATLSEIAAAPLRVPPLVLLGAPGIGKSRYAKSLAAALGTSCHTVTGTTLPDVGSLTGYPPVWRGAGPGRMAKFLLNAATSAPLIFVDEAEKIVDHEAMAHPLDRLLPLLEHGTAAAYEDENLQVPMRGQHALLLFAVNSLDGLSTPFMDRVLTVRVPDLTPVQRGAVLEQMLAEVGHELSLAVSLAGPEALMPLRGLSTRRCRLALELAVGGAVQQGRRVLLAADLAEAVALLAQPDTRAAVGFLPPRSADD